MKKVIFALVFALCGIFNVYSQYYYTPENPINVRIGAYGGYNFALKDPMGGAFVSVSGWNLMAEFDIGATGVHSEGEKFFYLNPSVGFYFGDKYRVFGLIGITNWGEYDEFEDEFRTNKIYCKLKLGFDIELSKNVFLTANWNYIVQDRKHRHYYDYYDRGPVFAKNNAICIGLGYKF